jgi:hypothetical protein
MSKDKWRMWAFIFFAGFWVMLWAYVAEEASGHGKGVPNTVDVAAHKHFGTGSLGQKVLRVVRCESGYRVNARSRDGRYFGLLQFDLGTWRSVGGTGDPASASADTQLKLGRRLYNRRGWQPWPVCGRV